MNFTARCFIGMVMAASISLSSTQLFAQVNEKDAMDTGTQAYIYGYPLVTMEFTRRVMTNTVEAKGTHAPMGQLVRMRKYPDASFTDVTAPNADTLYSPGWLDLAREPYVFSLPDMADRYFLMPMLSGWTDVFEVPGKRTSGTKSQAYVITGPNWKGQLPQGLKELKSPTNMVWILGRTYCTGTPEDYQACHAIMDKYQLVPLSAYGKAYTPPPGKVDPGIDMKTPVREQVHKLDAVAYFSLLSKLMKDNPPAQADAPILERLSKIGIVPGKDFDSTKLPAAAAKTIPEAAQALIMGHFKDGGTYADGWTFTTKAGVYGTDYLQRAFITAIGLGANRPQDAVYPTSDVDAEGQPYSGTNKYVMHFAKGQAPPVDGFWSLTMYNAQYFFVDNPLNKYTVSPRNNLQYNADGSLDLYIQHESPGKAKEANWLPCPKEKFVLMLRMYWPKETPPSIIDASWHPPGVRKVK